MRILLKEQQRGNYANSSGKTVGAESLEETMADENTARRKTVLKVLFVTLIILDIVAALNFAFDLATDEEITNNEDNKEDTNIKDISEHINTMDISENTQIKEEKR